MAASGVINGTTSNQYIVVKIEWKLLWQDPATNVSAVEAILYARRTNTGYVTSGTGSFTVSINGTAHPTSGYVEIGTSWVQIGSNAQEVAHEADGTKQINISASGSIPVAGLTSISVGGTVALDTIPRASQPSLSAGDFALGSTITINLNPASSSFTHAVKFSLGAYATTIGEGIKSSMTYQFPLDLASQMPNATSLQGRLWVDTYSGGTYIGTKEVYFTARVPTSVVPTAGALTISDAAGHAPKTGGVYVQGQSRVSVSVGQSSGIYGSTIKSTVIKVGSVSQAATAATFNLPTAGTVSISATVTDSRGRTHTRTSTISVVAYSPPVISSFTISRVNAGGTAEAMGSYVRAISSGSATNIPNPKLDWAVQWMNGATWTTLRNGSEPITLSWADNSVVGGGVFDPTQSYQFRLIATDRITSTTREITLPTGSVTMSWGKTGVGIGKVLERGTLDVGGDAYATNVRADGLLYEGGLDLDRLYGAGVLRYNFTAGYLIQTDIGPTEDTMWTLDMRLNTFFLASSVGTGEIQVQGYSYGSGSTMLATAATSTVGRRDVYAFFMSGYLHFWVPPGNSAETANFTLRTQHGSGSANRRIVDIANQAMPTAGLSRSVVIVPRTLGYDSGWQPLPITGQTHSFTRYEAQQYRVKDDQIFLRGGLHRDTLGGWTGDVPYVIGTIPAAVWAGSRQAAISVYAEPSWLGPIDGVVSETGQVRLLPHGTGNYWAVLGGSILKN